MHGLLLLVATGTSGGGEAPKYAGYDARSRQLLQELVIGFWLGLAFPNPAPVADPVPVPAPVPVPVPVPEP